MAAIYRVNRDIDLIAKGQPMRLAVHNMSNNLVSRRLLSVSIRRKRASYKNAAQMKKAHKLDTLRFSQMYINCWLPY